MSVAFLFVLIGIIELSLPEALVLSVAGSLIQCYWGAKKRSVSSLDRTICPLPI